MKKVKHVTFQTKKPCEQLVSSVSNLEQLDTPENVKKELEAEEILKLNTRITECEVKIKEIEIGITALLELSSAIEKLDRDKTDPITTDDIDAQIKLYKRQIHIYESKIRRNQDKIHAILTK